MTERLYFADPWLTSFQARVVAHGVSGAHPTVVLDRSAFYPEGGGQLADRGAIGGVPVVDVQVDGGGVVQHVVDGVPPAVGSEVTGDVDRARRRVHMALHTGQHMLSRALLDLARASTASARLGATGCTVDVERARIPEAEIAAAVDLVNAVIDDDVEVRAWFPEPGELASLPLRREPKVADEVRVVRIGEFDCSPCGGTHCTRTGQVGLVHVASVEAYKGMLRIHFDAGPRARRDLDAHSRLLRDIGRGFSCPPEGVPAALEGVQRELGELRGQLRELRVREAARTAAALAAAGDRVIAVVDGGVDAMRAVARRLTAEPTRVCLLASPGPDGVYVLVARGERASFACGEFVRRAAERAGGRGGGRPDRAEGRLPPGADWPGLVASLLDD